MITKITSGQVVFYCLAPALLIDAINGWLIRAYPGISISSMYRIFILAIILYWLAKHSRKSFLWACGVIGTVFVCTVYHSAYFEGLSWLTLDLHFQIRLITHFIYFLFLHAYSAAAIRSGGAATVLRDIKRVIIFSYIVVVANIFMGLMGIGYVAHRSSFGNDDEGYGGLGFFKAANDVSAVLLVIAAIVHYYVWNSGKGYARYLLISMVSLFAAIGLQSKVSLLGMVIVIGGIPVVSSGLLLGNLRLKKRPFVLLSGTILAGVALLGWLIVSEAGIVQRFMFFYEKSGLLFAVMTGRDYFVGMASRVFDSGYNFTDILFGHGWSYFLSEMGRLYKSEKLVEIDYIDIFMINGLTGFLMVMAIWGMYLYSAYRYAKAVAIGRAVLFVNLLLLGVAGGSGHVLYSVLNGLFIAILQVLPALERSVKRGQAQCIESEGDARVTGCA